MDQTKLSDIAKSLVASRKGILAADESSRTIQKRFDKIGLQSTPETNLAYREMLFSTPGIEQFLSGVILYDETIRQAIDGISMPKYLEDKGILPGIKVDKGVVDLANFPNEKITEGLDGLKERLEEYGKLGAKFTKWRAVITIGVGIPTDTCLYANAGTMARYAALAQNCGLVPIIEPEVLRDGAYNLQQCAQVTLKTLKIVFEEMQWHKVSLEGLILKTNMVTCGEDNPNQATPEEVAKASIEVYKEAVPEEIGGIVFLSGGQSPEMATANLAAINKIGGPRELSFSYSRALQDEALTAWAGKDENIEVAQQVFLERAKKVSEARHVHVN